MKKSLLALALAAATLAPLASANAATYVLSTDVSAPTLLMPGDIGATAPTGGTSDLSTLSGTGINDYYFDLSVPGSGTSYLGNIDFSGGSERAVVSLSSLVVSDITVSSLGAQTKATFSAVGGSEYKLEVSGTPGAYFVANITGVTAAVPEPATWAMMLAGLFGLGAALRVRRRGQGVMAATA